MKVIPYRPEYREAFVRLNTEWLTRFYWVESFDQYAMDHVDDLIATGAMAFFALDDAGEVLASSAVLQAAMHYAEENGATKEVLISCRSLKPAIHLYKKFGFREVPYRKDFWKSEKADIEMERNV